jgi:hypothetical protein
MEAGRTAPSMVGVRIVVLWNMCRGVSADEDARWVQEEAAKLRECEGVSALALHKVASAALRHPREWDWCLELSLDGECPDAVVRRPTTGASAGWSRAPTSSARPPSG